MKKAGSILIIFLFSAIITSLAQTPENNITATFNGVTEEGLYEFMDIDDEVYYFDEISDDVEIDLDKEKFIGKEFIVKWEEIEEEIFDDEEESTGEFRTTKTITYLEEI